MILKKRLAKIELKKKLRKELSERSTNLKYKRQYIPTDYRDNNYTHLQDIEYMFNSLDDYYKPILAQKVFNNYYQRYYIRGDKTRQF